MRFLAACLALSLAGCATLPAKQAGAFRTLAAADRDAFQALAVQENDAVTDYAKGYLRRTPGAEVSVLDCGLSRAGSRGNPPCKVILTPPPRPDAPPGLEIDPISIMVAAPETRALIGGLADYGASMAEMAEAADLEAGKAATGQVADSVKALVETVPGAPAVVGPVIDLVIWATNAGFKEKRRRALLDAARNADGAVQAASRQMGAIAVRLRSNLELAAMERLTQANEAYAATPNDQTFAALIAATSQVNAAREVRTDYSALAKGHRALVEALEKDTDAAAALGQIETFIGLVNAARTAAATDGSQA